MANVQFRMKCLELGNSSRELADQFWLMCARDMWFWVNTFVWTYDPRLPRDRRKIPFITNGDQDKALYALTEAVRLGSESQVSVDVAIEKSRGTGGTWINLLKIAHEFQFHPDGSFLLGSRKEDLVDKPDEPDSLMWKVDFIFNNQPTWLRPLVKRSSMKILNEENGSVITGESTNPDFGRGGRKSIILLDEFSKVPDAASINTACSGTANTRFFNSTHSGAGSEFNRICDSVRPELRIRLHWSGFKGYRNNLRWDANGKLSSDWYEGMCRKLPGKVAIAAELDICPIGSEALFFDVEVLRYIELNDCRPPMFTGDLLYDPLGQPTKFMEHPHGKLKLWAPLDIQGRPPEDDYKVGNDTATATGASNSTVNVFNKRTGIQVAEFADPNIQPDEMGTYAVAICRWFKRKDGEPAELIWEAQGPGRNFGVKVHDLGFGRIYFSQDENKITKDHSDRPGWFPTRDNKRLMLGEFAIALNQKKFIVRSLELVQELKCYVYAEDGRSIEFKSPQSGDLEDSSGARDNHGDRVISAGLCWKVAGTTLSEAEEQVEAAPSPWSFAGRALEHQQEAKELDKRFPFLAMCRPKKK